MTDINAIIEFFSLTKDQLKGFIIQLIATLIGAFVGFGLVILWDRKKRKKETQQIINQTINSIVSELEATLGGIKATKVDVHWDETILHMVGNYGLAATSAFNSITHSGNFTLLPTDLQLELSELYQKIKLYNSFVFRIIEFPYINEFNSAKREAESVLKSMYDKLKEIREGIEPVLKLLRESSV